MPSKTPLRLATSAAAVAAISLGATAATAQIKRPGAHPKYSVELDPHLLLQWTNEPFGDEGLGLGLRATIPFLDNGPIQKINNNMGIGFGLDWAHFSENCYFYRWDRRWPGNDFECTANSFWFPVVVQWNFFLTPVISVFGEPGLAIEHTRWSFEWWCNAPGARVCEYDDSDTDLEPVFFVGARFLFSDSVGLTVRLGSPYLAVGASILF